MNAWNLFEMRGLRADVKAKIAEATAVPERVRTWLAAEVDALPESAAWVEVTAIGQGDSSQAGKLMVNVQATVVGRSG